MKENNEIYICEGQIEPTGFLFQKKFDDRLLMHELANRLVVGRVVCPTHLCHK
jgi:hypothetical protein